MKLILLFKCSLSLPMAVIYKIQTCDQTLVQLRAYNSPREYFFFLSPAKEKLFGGEEPEVKGRGEIAKDL